MRCQRPPGLPRWANVVMCRCNDDPDVPCYVSMSAGGDRPKYCHGDLDGGTTGSLKLGALHCTMCISVYIEFHPKNKGMQLNAPRSSGLQQHTFEYSPAPVGGWILHTAKGRERKRSCAQRQHLRREGCKLHL